MDDSGEVIIDMGTNDEMNNMLDSNDEQAIQDGIHFDDTRYWMMAQHKTWISMSESMLKRHLKTMGVRSSLLKKEYLDGITCSPMDKIIHEIESKKRVAWAGPFGGRKAGIYEMAGQVILVTESPNLITPVEADPLDDSLARLDLDSMPYPRESDKLVGECVGWPLLGRFWRNLFTCLRPANIEEDSLVEDYDQLSYWYGWLQRSLKALYDDTRLRGHAVLLAGETNCGKSLTIWILQQLMGGRIARPLAWIEGKTQFNSSMFKSPFLVVDDQGAKTRIRDRKILSASMKQIVAVMSGPMEGKGKDDLELEPQWRSFFAANIEEQNLLVFPPLDDDIIDKVKLFKGYFQPWPWGDELTEDQIQARLKPELPYFIHWILNDFHLPEELKSQRFGLKSWLHPEIRAKIEFLSPEVRIWNFIERTVLISANVWKGAALPVEYGKALQKS